MILPTRESLPQYLAKFFLYIRPLGANRMTKQMKQRQNYLPDSATL